MSEKQITLVDRLFVFFLVIVALFPATLLLYLVLLRREPDLGHKTLYEFVQETIRLEKKT